jgi:hypothetical protein
VGAASTANAVIELKPNGRGDALLFPIYHGFFENYFTISNMENAWIQGHIRFRGAAWSGEMRDFDVILSPGDVMVFRLADIDGDGEWEIDQNLDPLNFKYTGMWANENMPFTCKDGSGNPIVGCMEKSDALIPPADFVVQVNPTLTFAEALGQGNKETGEGIINYQRQAGYVEFIGESVLDGMNHNIMNILIDPNANTNNAMVQRYLPYRTRVFNKLGTTAWVWSDADGSRGGVSWADDQGLSNVPNALSGTAFVTLPGWSHGLAYNAETLVNFRTATCGGNAAIAGDSGNSCEYYPRGEHRIDNYRIGVSDTTTSYVNPVSGSAVGKRNSTASPHNPHPKEAIAGFSPLAENRAVIVHDENGAISHASGGSPFGDYVYWWDVDNLNHEAAISFNNTWGSTLADGDDYEMTDQFADVKSNELRNRTQKDTVEPRQTGFVNVNGTPWSLRWTTILATSCTNSVIDLGFFESAGSRPIDDFDCTWTGLADIGIYVNSVAEVDEAIRAGGQEFSAYYMDNDLFDKSGAGKGRADGISSNVALTTQLVSFFPTKFFSFEWNRPDLSFNSLNDFTAYAAINMVLFPKDIGVQVWDIEEKPLGVAGDECISPATFGECFSSANIPLPFEVGIMGIDYVKGIIAPEVADGWQSGRVVIELLHDGRDTPYWVKGVPSKAFAGLMYALEWSPAQYPQEVLSHWRSMHRASPWRAKN